MGSEMCIRDRYRTEFGGHFDGGSSFDMVVEWIYEQWFTEDDGEDIVHWSFDHVGFADY